MLLTHAAYGDAVQWNRTDLDESETDRLATLLTTVSHLRQHLYRHPKQRHVAAIRRLLNMAPSGALARGVLPTPVHLSVELGVNEHGDPVVAGLLS